jgi:hypothetical protein
MLHELTKVLVQGLCELVQGRGHLEPLVKHPALPLNAYILGPLHKPVQVLLGRKGASDAKALGPLLEERVSSRGCSLNV